jgi:hypothetical protein
MTSEPEAGTIHTTLKSRRMTRTKRTAIALGALAGAAALLLLPACSDGDDSDDTAGVASLGDSSTDSTAASTDSSTAEENYQQAMLDYAQCMREQGVDMPDPQFSDGGASIDVFPGEGEPTAQEQNEIEAADSACSPILEEAEADMPAPSPEEEAEAREWALAFSQCMRDHGVEDYLDPQFDEDGGYMLSTTDAIRSDPDFQDAQTACQDEGSEPGGGPPPSDGGEATP